MKQTLFILLTCQVIFTSVYIFSKGFLLTRDSIQSVSTCRDFKNSEVQSGCWMPNYFDKLVIILVDALRHDFVAPSEMKKNFYENNLLVIHELLKKEPHNSMLLKFMANPPTTTMQRLKGLTTGSLPTFIDASKNFASDQITEDNLIDQFIASGKKVVALGDETWGNLFPSKFHRSFLSPSFNVKDLHTVDNNIVEHLSSEIGKQDWDVIIAHFLGVDHCGHTYGPDTPQMEAKLSQMNVIIENAIREIDNKTLLLVFGDHGMTPTGDHGGDTILELEASLFAFTKKNMFKSQSIHPFQEVSQIDLVPTLSLLFGIPIPFSNIGKVIENMVDLGSPQAIKQAYHLNVQQVHRYITTYQQQTDEIPQEKVRVLTEAYREFETHLNSSDANMLASNYLDIALSTCKESWAKFNVPVMSIAIICLVACIGITYKFEYQLSVALKQMSVFFFAIQMAFIIALFLTSHGVVLMTLCYVFFLHHNGKMSFQQSKLVGCLAILFCSVSFSNSYVLLEPSICTFFVGTTFLLELWKLLQLRGKPPRKSDSKKHSVQYHWLAVGVMLLLCLMKLAPTFWDCREEHLDCKVNTFFHSPLATLAPHARNIRFFTTISLISIYLFFLKWWLSYNGNLSSTMSYLLGAGLPIVCWTCVIIYWVADSIEGFKASIPYIYVVPWFVYLSSIASFSYFLYRPLLIHTIDRTKQLVSKEKIVPHIISQLHGKSNEMSNKPLVFGLGSGFSSIFLLSGCFTMLVMCLVSTDGLSLGLILLVASSFVFLLVHSFLVLIRASSFTKMFEIHPLSVFIWFLLCIQGFYTMGHQNTFSSIKWGAAFVGFDDNNQWMAVLLITFNTFSSHVWFGLLHPLLFVMPFTLGPFFPQMLPENMKSKLERREYLISELPDKSRDVLLQYTMLYMRLHSIKILFTCLASFILRRHLMVWKIFAPKFVFESLGFGATCVSTSLGHFLALRILGAYEKWNNDHTVTELMKGE